MLIVHAGNRIDEAGRTPPRFPAAHADDVRSRLVALFGGISPSRLVTAAAAGADLLAIEAAHEVGVPVTVALPLLRDEFRRRSVADQGGDWILRYDSALDAADEVIATDLSDDDEWYLNGNEHILDVAAGRAGDDPVLALAVRAGTGSATDDLIDRAAARGWPSIDLDPSVPPGERPTVVLDDPPPVEPALLAALIDLDLAWVHVPATDLSHRLAERRAELGRLAAFADPAS